MDGRNYRTLPAPRAFQAPSRPPSAWGLEGDPSQSRCPSYSDPPFRHGPAAPDSAPPFSGSSSSYTLAPIRNDYEAAHGPFAQRPEPHPERARPEEPRQSAVVNGHVNGGFNVGNFGFHQPAPTPAPAPEPPVVQHNALPSAAVEANPNKRPRSHTDARARAAEKNDMELLTTLCADLKLSAAHSSTLQAFSHVRHTCFVSLFIAPYAISRVVRKPTTHVKIACFVASTSRIHSPRCKSPNP